VADAFYMALFRIPAFVGVGSSIQRVVHLGVQMEKTRGRVVLFALYMERVAEL